MEQQKYLEENTKNKPKRSRVWFYLLQDVKAQRSQNKNPKKIKQLKIKNKIKKIEINNVRLKKRYLKKMKKIQKKIRDKFGKKTFSNNRQQKIKLQ